MSELKKMSLLSGRKVRYVRKISQCVRTTTKTTNSKTTTTTKTTTKEQNKKTTTTKQ